MSRYDELQEKESADRLKGWTPITSDRLPEILEAIKTGQKARRPPFSDWWDALRRIKNLMICLQNGRTRDGVPNLQLGDQSLEDALYDLFQAVYGSTREKNHREAMAAVLRLAKPKLSRNNARDTWLWKKRCQKKPLLTFLEIQRELEEKIDTQPAAKKWVYLDSEQGIDQAIERWALRNSKPMPEPRKH
jgi:hypothetical protein